MESNRTKAFVTGGTGLLGCHIVEKLLAKGWQVTALVRSVEKSRKFFDSRVKLVEGDLCETAQFEKSMAGHDVLIHSAAYFSQYQKEGGAKDLLFETNVKGTASLLETAYNCGIRNCVYISSAGVLDIQKKGATDETCLYQAVPDNPYFESKIEAEKAVFKFLASHQSMRLITILPTVMLGPGDRGPTPIGGFIQKLLRGEIKIVLPGSLQFADARDVAQAAVAAIEKGTSTSRYIVGGTRVAQKELYRLVGEAAAKPMPTKQPPYPVILTVAWLMKQLSRIRGKQSPVDPAHIKRMNRDFLYTSQKSEQELGVRFRPVSETVCDTVKWFQTENMV